MRGRVVWLAGSRYGNAGVAELEDAADLKSAGPIGPWGFESPPRHQRDEQLIDG